MGKKTLPLICTLLFCIILATTGTANAQEEVKIEIIFENGLNEIVKEQCDNFTVTVKVTLPPGVEINFCDVEIHWNTTVLELQTGNAATDVIEGPWMKSFGTTLFASQPADNVNGILPDIAGGYLAGGPATGSGDFCYIEFHMKAAGESNITLFDPAPPGDQTYLLMGAQLVDIDVVINGLVVPEFPAALLLPLFLIITTIAIIATTLWSRKRRIPIKIL